MDGLSFHLLQQIHIHETVLGGGRTAGQRDGGREVILLSDSSAWLLALQHVRELLFQPASFISFKYSREISLRTQVRFISVFVL